VKSKRKRLFNIAFLVIVFALTLYGVLRGHNISEVVFAMHHADIRYILLAIGCVFLFLSGQALIIWIMMRSLHQDQKMWKCLLYSFTGYFYCSITPFASGGPPMQIFYMRKEKVPIPVSSIVMLIVTFMFKAVLVVVGFGLLLFGRDLIGRCLGGVLPIFGIGLFLTIGFSFLLALFIFRPNLAKKAMLKGLGWLERKRLMKHKEGRRERLSESMDKYRETALFFKSHLLLMVLVFCLTLLQRFCLFLATYCVYRAFGLRGISVWVIVILQAAISISADMLPLPGGMGVSEALFLSIFAAVFGAGLVFPGMVLSRGITYYVQLLFCAAMAVVSHFALGREPLDRDFVKNMPKTEEAGTER
jgi:uncharacterized protein (TIRG00374 family)